MTGKPTKQSRNHPATVGNALVSTMAGKAMQQRGDDGRMLAVLTDDQVDYALECLANGDTMKSVTARLGVNRSAFLVRANKYPEFMPRLRAAMEMGTLAMLENAADAVSGGENSSGSVERDRLIVDYAKWYASRVGRRMFGDKLEIEQRTIQINIAKDDSEW